MYQVFRRQPWTCTRCLKRQKRSISTATAAISSQEHSYEDAHVANKVSSQSNNRLLRDVFNNKAFWNDFAGYQKKSSGLIGNKYLTTPRGFQKFAETALKQCKKLVEKTLAASTIEEYVRIPKDLDRLSDLLCRVIDLSDFIRGIHSDSDVASAATASYSLMFQYMNELNTTTGLNEQLRQAISMPEVRSRWSREEEMVAQILMKDFLKSGIHLPAKQREEFVSLSNDIVQIGTDFTNGMEHARDHVALSGKQLYGVDPTIIQGISSWRKVSVPVYSPIAKMIMNNADDSATRKELYIAERTASSQTIGRLERLLSRRAQLAKLTGFSNFAEMTLADKMSKTPEAVNNFLLSLNNNNRGQVEKELSRLMNAKRKIDPSATSVAPWDHAYLLSKISQERQQSGQRTSKSRLHESAKSFFAVGHVIQGLSNLFEQLYGVRLIPKETLIGETWDPEVRRLDVYTENQEHIATMYCDLYSRPGKLPNPAHFTLTCSREISTEEVRECEATNQPLNDGMPTYQIIDPTTGKTTYHQIPVIALVCDFPEPHSSSDQPSLLSSHSVTTLFHEMGHAIHSILGRTSLQGISGTRCATDFAELPSVLMEYFATDAEVLKLFARHWETDVVIPDELLQALAQEKKDQTEMTGGWENENQILMALLDQVYHSEAPVQALGSGRYDSTAAYHQIWNQYGSVHEPTQTAWQGFFGHLYGYGATYYSYLFDRAIARQVWRAVFRDGQNGGAIDRFAGERFKTEVLQWGGGRDPWICLEGLMGEGKGILAEGGDAAMLEVGKWGVGAGAEAPM